MTYAELNKRFETMKDTAQELDSRARKLVAIKRGLPTVLPVVEAQ